MILSLAQRRFGRAVKAKTPTVPVQYVNGTVKTVTAGGSSDGKAAVVVTVNGTDTPAPYLDSYLTPAVGDMVAVLIVAGSPLIIGRIIGLPVF